MLFVACGFEDYSVLKDNLILSLFYKILITLCFMEVFEILGKEL